MASLLPTRSPTISPRVGPPPIPTTEPALRVELSPITTTEPSPRVPSTKPEAPCRSPRFQNAPVILLFDASIGVVPMGLMFVSVREISVMIWYFCYMNANMSLFYVGFSQWRGVGIWSCVSFFVGGLVGGSSGRCPGFVGPDFQTGLVDLFRCEFTKLVS